MPGRTSSGSGTRAWTAKHRQWLEGLKFAQNMHRIILGEYLHALDQGVERVERLEKEIAEAVSTGELAAAVAALQTLRGVGLITAATLVAEIGDITRFRTARQLMSYAGLVPSEYSSGTSQRRGAVTKAGNAHIRRVVVEAAWHYRHQPRVGAVLHRRQEGQPERIKDLSWKAQARLHLKYRRMTGRGKPKQVAVVAVARELLGFVWAVAREVGQLERVAA